MSWRELITLHRAYAATISGALVLFLAGYAAGTCGKATNDELESAHDSTSAAVERAEQAEEARAAIEIQALADVMAYQASRDSVLLVARNAQARRPTIIERVVERAGVDSAVVRIAVEEVVDSIVSYEVTPLRAALVAQDSAFLAQGRLLSAERETRLRAQEALTAALTERDALRSARPSWFSRNWSKAAIPAAIAVGWYARGQLGR